MGLVIFILVVLAMLALIGYLTLWAMAAAFIGVFIACGILVTIVLAIFDLSGDAAYLLGLFMTLAMTVGITFMLGGKRSDT